MMEFLFEIERSIPLFQIVFLLLFSTVAILFGKMKLALLINYSFTVYWAYFFNKDYLLDLGPEKFSYYTGIYFAVGLLMLFLAAIGFLFQQE